MKNRVINSSLFAFQPKMTAISYIILFSISHHMEEYVSEKRDIYSMTKDGVYTLDELRLQINAL